MYPHDHPLVRLLEDLWMRSLRLIRALASAFERQIGVASPPGKPSQVTSGCKRSRS